MGWRRNSGLAWDREIEQAGFSGSKIMLNAGLRRRVGVEKGGLADLGQDSFCIALTTSN